MVTKRQHGFTLLEALLSVGLLAIIVSISLPLYASFTTRTNLDTTGQSIVEMMRRAQVYSRGVNGDTTWGVRVESTFATLFRGASYATRDSAYDETTTIPTTMTKGGTLTEVVFAELTGVPSATGTVTLTQSPSGGLTITLNAEGMVEHVTT